MQDVLTSFSCKRTLKTKKELLTDVNMILDYENGIRGGIPKAIYQYGKANNKYIHDYDETKESTHIQYLVLAINTDGLYRNHFFMVILFIY